MEQGGKAARDLTTEASQTSQSRGSLGRVSSFVSPGCKLRALRAASFLCGLGSEGGFLATASLAWQPLLRAGSERPYSITTRTPCMPATLSAQKGTKKRLSRQMAENKPPDGLAIMTSRLFSRSCPRSRPWSLIIRHSRRHGIPERAGIHGEGFQERLCATRGTTAAARRRSGCERAPADQAGRQNSQKIDYLTCEQESAKLQYEAIRL